MRYFNEGEGSQNGWCLTPCFLLAFVVRSSSGRLERLYVSSSHSTCEVGALAPIYLLFLFARLDEGNTCDQWTLRHGHPHGNKCSINFPVGAS